MRDIEIKVVSGAELAEKLRASASAVHGALRHEVAAAQLKVAAAMKRNIKQSFRQRTGDFSRSIVSEPLLDSGNEISGRTGSNLEYAEIQEKGGTIHAKNVRNLTIPLDAFMTGQGVARGTARDVIADPQAYGYDGTFFSKGVLFGKQGEEAEPLFALKPSVTLPARPWAQPAADEVAPEFEAGSHSAIEALL